MNSLASAWSQFVNMAQSLPFIFVIGGCIFLIALISFFAITKIMGNTAGIRGIIAVMISTLAACFLMIPVVVSFNHILEKHTRAAIMGETSKEIELQQKKVEIARLETEKKLAEKELLDKQIQLDKQSIELQSKNNQISLLKDTQQSIISFNKTLKLILAQLDLNQNMVRYESIGEPQKNNIIDSKVRGEYYQDSVLVIASEKVEGAQLGIDLRNVMVEEAEADTLVVSGIKSEYQGSMLLEPTNIISEMRRSFYTDGQLKSTVIMDDKDHTAKADEYYQNYQKEYANNIKKGIGLGFMSDNVNSLAQNYITVLLAPLHKKIIFMEKEHSDSALPLMTYLQKQIEKNETEKNELQKSLQEANESVASNTEKALDLENSYKLVNSYWKTSINGKNYTASFSSDKKLTLSDGVTAKRIGSYYLTNSGNGINVNTEKGTISGSIDDNIIKIEALDGKLYTLEKINLNAGE